MVDWILTADWLPDYNVDILITVKMFTGELAVYKAKFLTSKNARGDYFKTEHSNFFAVSKVIAWMPYPIPYTGKEGVNI